MEPDAARRFHGHSCKRYCLNVAESSPLFDSIEATEVGRFSGSTAQDSDLEPREAMLRAHTQRVSVLPAIYASLSKKSLRYSMRSVRCILWRAMQSASCALRLRRISLIIGGKVVR